MFDKIATLYAAMKHLDRIASALEEHNRVCRYTWQVPSLEELAELPEPTGVGISFASDAQTLEIEEDDAQRRTAD